MVPAIWGGRHAVLVRRWGVVDSAVGLRPFEEADLALLARFAVDPAFSKPFEWAAYRSPEALRRRWEEDGFPERDPRQLVVADAEDTGLGWVMWRDPNLGDGIDIETVRWPRRLGECRASLHGGGRTSAGDSTRGAYAGWPAMLDSLLANRAAQPDQWARPGTESSRSGLRRPDRPRRMARVWPATAARLVQRWAHGTGHVWDVMVETLGVRSARRVALFMSAGRSRNGGGPKSRPSIGSPTSGT
jgi:hypothetical protein